MMRNVILEPEAEIVCDESVKCPRIYQLPPKEGRKVLEQIQNSPITLYSARIEKRFLDTGNWGNIPVYIVQPDEVQSNPNVILYMHGAGWVFGSYHTHEKLVRELASRTNCTVVFPEYSRAPEAQYPIALEQCYSILCKLPELVHGMNPYTLTVAGDSAGGNLAAALSLLSKFRHGPRIQKQLFYYPVTNACFHTKTYCMFAFDYYLYREEMIWFWNQYTPSEKIRQEITVSPLQADLDQLRDLPDTMILNGEADVLREEGEAFANRLRIAGNQVTALRFQAIIHDFVMLNALDQTHACRAAMDISTEWIRRKNTVI